jgi:hypothetical protein
MSAEHADPFDTMDASAAMTRAAAAAGENGNGAAPPAPEAPPTPAPNSTAPKGGAPAPDAPKPDAPKPAPSADGSQPRDEAGRFTKDAAAAAAAAAKPDEGKPAAPAADAKKPENAAAPTAPDLVVPYVYKGEKKEADFGKLLGTPAGRDEVRTRWQKSEDYDRQRSIAEDAQRRGLSLLEHFEKRGLIAKDPVSGQYRDVEPAPRAPAPGTNGAPASDDPATTRIDELEKKFESDAGLTRAEMSELTELKAERRVRKILGERDAEQQTRDRTTREESERSENARRTEEMFQRAERQLDTDIDSLKMHFVDPLTGAVDTQVLEDLRAVAKAQLRQTGDLNRIRSHLAERARAAQTRAQQFEARLTKAATRDAIPPAPGGGTAASQAPKQSGIDLDAPSGLDGISEAAKRWESATRR